MELPFTGPALVFLTLFVIVLVAPPLAERVRVPGVIGLVVAGLAVGPEGMGLLERAGSIEQIGGLGLLYLMFLAGLELDLDAVDEDRRPTIVFGLLTFAIPMTAGTSVALALDFSPLAAVLIGSLWASHTLVAYPIVRRTGIVGDPSVTAAVGGTVITDTLALMVLAVVARSFGSDGGGALVLATLIPGLVVLAGWTAFGLPRVADWFLRGMGQDRNARFVFVLVGFLSSAVLAEVVGIEGIIGAFMAGLALNRRVPNGGVLMQRVEFVGSSLLIPIFLISVGMLVDLRVVLDEATLGLAAAFTAVAMGGKWLAAEVSGRILGFDRAQVGVLFALSNAQAAATLAATIVGFEIGLFDDRVVNAVLLVILVTVIVSSTAGSRAAPRVVSSIPVRRVGQTVLVPIARPESAVEVVRLATWIAGADGGTVTPFHVVTAPEPDRISGAEPILRLATETASRMGAEVEAFARVDRSAASGVVNTVVERDASLVLLGWKGEVSAHDRLFGSVLDEIVSRVPCVVAACFLPGTRVRRFVLMVSVPDAPPGDVVAAVEVCRKLMRGSGIPAIVVGAVPDGTDTSWAADPGGDVELGPGDIVVIPGGSGRTAVGTTAHQLALSTPGLGLVAVHSATPRRSAGLGEVLAGG